MYALKVRSHRPGRIDLCVICGDGYSTPETHLRITGVEISREEGQTLWGRLTDQTQVQSCDKQSCRPHLLDQGRITVLERTLDREIGDKIFQYRLLEQQKITHQIQSGPSREELFLALRLNHEERTVAFQLQGGIHIPVTITGISVGHTQRGYEGCAWSFTAHDKHLSLGHLNLLGHYRTDRRTGHIQIDR